MKKEVIDWRPIAQPVISKLQEIGDPFTTIAVTMDGTYVLDTVLFIPNNVDRESKPYRVQDGGKGPKC